MPSAPLDLPASALADAAPDAAPETSLSRRRFLKTGALVGCSIAAQPFLTTITFAAAPGDARFVVLILRGAMDGLDVVRPVGDPAFKGLRKATLEGKPSIPLDGIFALHPDLAPLMPLWKAGELGFAHAVSTPYRDKRSHFDGQDILEAGTGLDMPDRSVKDGWLNRMLQAMPGLHSETAFAVGRDEMKVIMGKAPYDSWAPDTRLGLSAQSRRLLEAMYHDDPLFRDAAVEAIALTGQLDRQKKAAMASGGMQNQMMAAALPAVDMTKPDPVAAFAASRLRGETRIATFSITGWDSHAAQRQILGRELSKLANTILTLKTGLGDTWKKTTLVAMTEFGRTAWENGSGGTDHGTGGVMLLAGGAIKGGKVYGRWPGLDEAALYERRDLMPTADVRSYAAWAMRGLYGLDTGLLENTIFPKLDMGSNPGILA
ncbi:DUF1501 domain-containing protein [Solirhodobacter olei]|uniref:DUF1501 domain-containing protein n=1 Tax=Solirhodobacter olei TaxID=2493082 RepID=UPI000FD95202|nr:DUF1501 domain-containing protein [Solirhodobacter olei]